MDGDDQVGLLDLEASMATDSGDLRRLFVGDKWTLSNNPMPAPDKNIVPNSRAFHATHFIGSFGD